MKEKLINFWRQNETKTVLAIGLVLVSLISFQAGYLKGQSGEEGPVVVEKNTECPLPQVNKNESIETTEKFVVTNQKEVISKEKELVSEQIQGNAENIKCLYVGSKNSNKYHLPNCRWAKNIKPENLICFSSLEEVQKKGYQPDKNCIK